METDKISLNQNKNANVQLKLTRSKSLECLEELHKVIDHYEDKSLDKKQSIFYHFQWLLRDDKFLFHFIRGCKYSSQKAFSKLQLYLQQRVVYADIVHRMIPSEMSEVCKILNHRGPKGELIVMLRACYWDVSKMSADEYLISGMANHEILWDDECTEKHGCYAIWEMGDYGTAHFRQMGPLVIKKFVQLTYNAFPLRIQAVHVVNAPAVFIALYSAIKYLLPTKFRERVIIHGRNMESLLSLVPAEKLPMCIGGLASDSEAFRDDIFPAILAKENYYKKFSQTIHKISQAESFQ